jgi:hypothetical protein
MNLLITEGDISHKYRQLPLIPVEEFLELHPEHKDANEVALTIARIDHEHAEREALEQQRQGLLKRKQGLIADNKKRKDDLANLDQQLEAFIDVSLLHVWILGQNADPTATGGQADSENTRESGLSFQESYQRLMMSK